MPKLILKLVCFYPRYLGLVGESKVLKKIKLEINQVTYCVKFILDLSYLLTKLVQTIE